MHEIQKHILKKLSLEKNARYSDLKPKGVEGNLFVYHLKLLIKDGYVSNTKDSYRLTAEGRRFVDRVSFETFRERIQPKIVTLLVIKNAEKYLFYRRTRSPFNGRVGFPYGKIHLEERLDEAASRELEEKTGLKLPIKHRGIVYISVHDETELVSHMLCHIFTGSVRTRGDQSPTPKGECFWSRFEDIPKNELIPGVPQIIGLLKKNAPNNKSGSSDLFFGEYFLNTSEE